MSINEIIFSCEYEFFYGKCVKTKTSPKSCHRLSSRSLSPFDNCPVYDGRA